MNSPKKHKKNPNKIAFTQADMKKAEAKWDKQLQQMKVEATSDATKFVYAVVYSALIHEFNWTTEELIRLQAERKEYQIRCSIAIMV